MSNAGDSSDRTRPRALHALALAAGRLALGLALAVPTGASDGAPRDLATVRQSLAEGAASSEEVTFSGTVTYADRVWGFLHVQEGEHGIFVRSERVDTAEPGDRVELTGTAELRDGLPTLAATRIERTGAAPLPDPVEVDLASAEFGKHDATRVRTRGRVLQAIVQERRTRLVLRSGEALFFATLTGNLEFEQVEEWIGRAVELTGTVAYFFAGGDESGAFSYQLFLNGADDLRTAGADLEPAARTTRQSYGRELRLPGPGVYSLHTQITFVGSDHLIAQSGEQAIRIEAETTLGLQPGQVVRASIRRSPTADGEHRLQLVQPLTSTQLPDPLELPAEGSLLEHEYLRVSVRGGVASWTATPKGAEIVLERATAPAAVVRVEGSEISVEELALDSVLELSASGTLLLAVEPEDSSSTATPIVVVHDLGDLDIVARRTMLSVPTVLLGAGVIISVCMVLLFWVRYLRERVSEKTAYLVRLSAQLRSSYEAIDDGLVAVDPNGRIFAVNSRAKELFDVDLRPGARLEDLRRAMSDRSASEDEFERVWDRCLQPQQARPRVSSWTTAGAEPKIFAVSSALFTQDESSQVEFGRLWIFRDMTHERTLESNIRRAQKLDAIGTLAGGIAHDFNNLLTVISGNLAMLRTELAGWSNTEFAEHLTSAEAATHRAAAVARRLLTLAQQGEIELAPISVNGVVDRLSVLLQRALGSRYELECSLDDDLPMVRADANLLEQVLLNLCVNARDAMPEGGSIAIRSEVQGRDGEAWIVVAVTDSGHGITPEIRDRIFEPFFSTKGEGRGSGLGLAVSYGVIRQHGGALEFDSRVGVGTEFRVLLPACSSERPLSTPEQPASATAETSSAHVLVIDDEAPVRTITERILSHHEHRVSTAADGAAGLEFLAENASEVDVVLLDLTMPGIDGVEVLRRIRRDHPELTVVLCSGYSATEAVEGIYPPPAGFVRKPYAVDALLGAIEKAACLGRERRGGAELEPEAAIRCASPG